jgi:two-component system sensor histidine kinase AlgZ
MANKVEKNITGTKNSSYLPDFCNGDVFLRLLLVLELVAIVFALVSFGKSGLIVHIALISVMMLWVGLSTAALLCWISRQGWLGDHKRTSWLAITITLAMTLAVSLLSLGLGSMIQFGPTAGDFGFTLIRNLSVALILVGLALRYFYLQYESKMIMEVQAQARLQALQARIRPHFLFNSMNTIASLTHEQPDLAEQAIENLSDLFRASLAAEASISLEHELELTLSYVDLESLRLGERLEFNWHVPDPGPKLNLPALTLQPLVENAIYHGVEPLPEGGKVDLNVSEQDGMVEISISNPLATAQIGNRRPGNQMAVENIRERLQIAFAGAATMEQSESETRYTVLLRIPSEEIR